MPAPRATFGNSVTPLLYGNGMFAELVDEVKGLDDQTLTARFRAVEAKRRALEAELAAVVGEAHRRRVFADDGHASVRAWMRALAAVSNAECTRRIQLARLVDLAPAVGDALLGGGIGVSQCGEMARAAANPRCGAEITDVVPLLIDKAPLISFDAFRLLVRRWEALADTDGAHRSRAATHAARTASIGVFGDVAHLSAHGAAVDGAAMMNIFERFRQAEFDADHAAARAESGDGPLRLPRTDAQRRFDALRAIFTAAATAPADGQTPEPEVTIVVDQVTFETHLARRRLLRLDPNLPNLRLDQRRCETANGVPVTPEDALQAAIAGRVRRVVFDSAGTVIDLGRRCRLFVGAAAEAVRLALQQCGFPGCDLPEALCQLDHLTDWADDGRTDPHNGAPMCGRHNRLKNRGFRIERDDDGHLHTYRPDGSEIT